MITPEQYVSRMRTANGSDDGDIRLPCPCPTESIAGNGQFYDLSEGRLLYIQDQDDGYKWAFRFPTRIVVVKGALDDGEPSDLTIAATYALISHGYSSFFINDFESTLGDGDVETGWNNSIQSVKPGFYETDSKNGYTYFTPHFVEYYNEGTLHQFWCFVLAWIGLASSNPDPIQFEQP